MRQEAINSALLKAYSDGLTPDDCKKLDAVESAEVARILIEDSKIIRGVETSSPTPRRDLSDMGREVRAARQRLGLKP